MSTTTVTTPIEIGYPESTDSLELRIEAGACRLRLSPTIQDAWITGTYRDPSNRIPIRAYVEGSRAIVRMGDSPADYIGIFEGLPELDVQVGTLHPFSLSFAGGASENSLALGGLPLKRVELSHGAGSLEVTFSAPNPQPMSLFKAGVGAGRTSLRDLGNANFRELIVDGGAASCSLDFSGAPIKDASCRVSTAMASVQVFAPKDLAIEVTSDGLLSQPRGDQGFNRTGSRWLSQTAAAGKPIQLRLRSSMVMGALELHTIG